mmetsp:Transcript_13307/g.34662  ORF Transcript_13307/g.34662 Transcript_13307/m.34662 type:complete len:214 (+) Transcript_13307:436-1077(+)
MRTLSSGRAGRSSEAASSRSASGFSRRRRSTSSSMGSSCETDASVSAAANLATCSQCFACSFSTSSTSASSSSPVDRPRAAASRAAAASICARTSRSALMRAIFCSRWRIALPLPVPPPACSEAASSSVTSPIVASDSMKRSRCALPSRRCLIRRSWSTWRMISSPRKYGTSRYFRSPGLMSSSCSLDENTESSFTSASAARACSRPSATRRR